MVFLSILGLLLVLLHADLGEALPAVLLVDVNLVPATSRRDLDLANLGAIAKLKDDVTRHHIGDVLDQNITFHMSGRGEGALSAFASFIPERWYIPHGPSYLAELTILCMRKYAHETDVSEID
jgi:hypothetical protein